MSPAMLGAAAEMIETGLVSHKMGAVLLYLIRTPGTDTPWPSLRVPVGRTVYCIVGRYDRGITLGELRDDLAVAEREMRGAVAA